ncbi:hypothetical protein CBR_g22369 [Chara braunii]|uniref:CBS domain-containing protein n=1 Tax=Chara braunii TaxID=69332 RepID=A0A388JV33_CHABU|nr:hypothetical protein CBR_g22369 [Chara braunii]|eukprot:GBG61572.1 hypothetical protein CBR_g22369 [Chara braunii]
MAAACGNSCLFASSTFASSSSRELPSGQLVGGVGHSQASGSGIGGGHLAGAGAGCRSERRHGRGGSSSSSPSALRGGSVSVVLSAGSSSRRHSRKLRPAAAQDDEAQTVQTEKVVEAETTASSILPSGEWPENFSLLNYEDLGRYFEPYLLKPEHDPSSTVADIMKTAVKTVQDQDNLDDVLPKFEELTGLPVVNSDMKCVGVVTKRDVVALLGKGPLKVADAMTSPAITVSVTKTVAEAAVIMLRHRIHRLPVVNDTGLLLGIITRTDMFTALEHHSS